MSKFDKQLQTYSHRLTLLRLLKNQLSNQSDQVYKTIMMSDKESKGYFNPQQIQMLWMQSNNTDESMMKKFMTFHFPVKKISYSVLARFICYKQETTSATQQIQTKKFDDIIKNIKEVFNLELANYVSFSYLNQQISNSIPSVGSKPTKNQFQDYIVCKELVVDIQAVSKALFLAQVAQTIPHNSEADKFEDSLNQPSVQNMRKIMQRLKQKVNAFGNECLN